MSFNTALLNGDMREVNVLLGQGYSWVGTKANFDSYDIKYPTDPELFSQFIRYILDNDFTDANFGYEDLTFTWFTSPTRLEVEKILRLLSFDSKYEHILPEQILTFYLKALSLYENEFLASLKEVEDFDYAQPQIKISGTRGKYNFVIEAYSDCKLQNILDLNLDTHSLDCLLKVMSSVRFYTC